MKNLKTILPILFLLISLSMNAQEFGVLKDSRDGKSYKTISFSIGDGSLYRGSMTLMAENLDYEIDGGTYIYNDDKGYRQSLGLLYTWEAAMRACPDGWHIPTQKEWDIIVNKLAGGRAMKSKVGWNYSGNGTNSSGFNGLPGGHRNADGGFHFIGDEGFWWSSTTLEEAQDHAHKIGLVFSSNGVNRLDFNKKGAISCRCVKD